LQIIKYINHVTYRVPMYLCENKVLDRYLIQKRFIREIREVFGDLRQQLETGFKVLLTLGTK
jgi:hypothetical protein